MEYFKNVCVPGQRSVFLAVQAGLLHILFGIKFKSTQQTKLVHCDSTCRS